MSIFSRLRKRDSDDATAPDTGAKAHEPPAKPAGTAIDGKPSAPREEQPKAAASKAAPTGATRAYPAAKASAPRPPAAVASPTQARNLPGMSPSGAPRSPAAQGEDDQKVVRGGGPPNGAVPAKAANAPNGGVAANGVPATPAAAPPDRRSPPVAATRALEEGTPDRALSAPGSIDLALESLLPTGEESPPGTRTEGTSTAADRKAVMATFEELSVGHTAPLRSFMLEVRWGEAQTSWIGLARPALKSLRAMASQMEHATLPAAIDAFDAALAELLRPGAPSVVANAGREALLAAYAPLIAAMPRAFELDGERDRREPVVVRALLEQVSALAPLMVDRMMAAGLGRLEALYQAKGDEIAVVADIPADIAAATVERIQAFRRATPAALAAPDRDVAVQELCVLVGELGEDHRGFETAGSGWTEADRQAKKRMRRKREVDFARLTIALARLGEVDLALHLPKIPFQRRLEELEVLTRRLGAAAPAYGQFEIEERTESGAQAAP